MTRGDQLCYCLVCTRRKFEQTNGFICGLTNKIADFEETCEQFDLDKQEKNKNSEKYRAEIYENIEKRKTFLKRIAYSGPMLFFLTEAETRKLTNNKFDEIVVNESKSKKAHFLWLPALLLGMFGYSYYKNGLIVNDLWQVLILVVLFVGLPGVLLYYYFRDKELFRMSDKGLIIEKKTFISWFRISYMHFEVVPQKSENTINLVLRMSYGDDYKIEITYAHIPQDQLGLYLYNYLKKFKPN